MIIILTIVLASSFLSSGDNLLVETMEIEIVEKKPITGDKLSDDPSDFSVFSSYLLCIDSLTIDHNYTPPYNSYEANLSPFRPPRYFLAA